METQGFNVLNGRTKSDSPAQPTYISKISQSILDLIWVNIPCLVQVNDLQVGNEIHVSDHLLCTLTIEQYENQTKVDSNKQKRETAPPTQKRIHWREDKAQQFGERLETAVTELLNIQEKNPVEIYNMFKNACHETSVELGIMHTVRPQSKQYKNKPWYNPECKIAKQTMKKSFAKYSKNRNNENYLKKYLEDKNIYKTTIGRQKRAHTTKIKETINNIEDSKHFWTLCKQQKPRSRNQNPINMTKWEQFYKETYRVHGKTNITYISVLDPFLDAEISSNEIRHAQ